MSKERIEKARIQLLINHPFFGHLANYFEFEEDPEIKGPLSTKGPTLIYNPDKIREYSNEEIQTSLAHVIMHTALGHIWRRENRDKSIWTASTDQAVNHLLKASEFKLPNHIQLKASFRDKSAEEIYVEIKQEIEKKSEKKAREEQKAGDKKTNNKKQIKPKTTQNQNKKELEQYKGAGIENTIDSHEKWEEATTEQQKNIQEEWKRRMTEALEHAEKEGQLPGAIERTVRDITEPTVNWRDQLRQYVMQHARDDYNWLRPNRRLLQYDIYYPSARNEKLEIAIAVDTSGSISDQELNTFLAEVKEILNYTDNYTINLLACDAEIHSHMKITSEETSNINHQIKKFTETLKGRGGTKYSPVLEELKGKGIQLLIYLTDGKCSEKLEKPNYDVIWAISEDGTTDRITFGKTLRIKTPN
ncbi:VWA-like domain-containing protein [Methanonatronarchaeum sp. AMET6-2]|uniref:vWA domain-containing protein n=1 Tax=Methanonatronarchaeum sp. AMET6-2 TaxID=2933293 RepID=UPI001FF4037E|nr:VWA-like domain-containing protein [Methanonatronarchaeum sp. AMET6-2]UOY09444.1 VWA-like domain-containing protein [Methanonatronarchaeum sp. AMET6-2]